jgi:hypothetical protein
MSLKSAASRLEASPQRPWSRFGGLRCSLGQAAGGRGAPILS